MSSSGAQSTRYVVVCVDDEPEVLDALVRDVERICRPAIDVEACADADQALKLIEGFSPPDARVPLIITDHVMPRMSGVDLLLALHEKPDYRSTRKVLLSARTTIKDITRALNRGALHRNLSKPWTRDALLDCVRSLLTGYFIHHAPEEVDRLGNLVDAGQFPRAYEAARRKRQELDSQVSTLRRSFLADFNMNTEEVEQAMIEGVDQALDRPQRRHHPAGSILLREGQTVNGVSIMVSGKVQLFRVVDSREITLHRQSAGRVIGLLALAHGHKAAYTCRAITDVEVIPISLEQLETALQANPSLSNHFVTVLIRSLARRNRRVAELQIEIRNLTYALEAERDQLAKTLQELENAQMRLVESEKMAQLGQLSAGVAHELNNPIAAIQRAVDFIREDLMALLSKAPEGETHEACMVSALNSEPVSTREQRKRRAALSGTVGNDALARRLVNIGITTPEEYQSGVGQLSDAERERRLDSMERHYQLGSSLRNLASCSERIGAIVNSLRSYARADEAPVAHVNLHDGLEDALLLFGHALRDVEVERVYGDLPTIECHAGQINQVWTNIISNALHAMDNKGVLQIETDTPDVDHVRVRITDSGRGVPPEHLARVFDLNFTTKQGQASFGLGMGMAICRQIVARHAGTIEMESQTGRTCVAVVLPSRYVQTPGVGKPEQRR